MTIRFATQADIAGIVTLAERMHPLTRFTRQPFQRDKVAASTAAILTNKQHRYVCFVAEDGQSDIVGGLIGVLETQIFSDAITASVMHFDVLPDARMGGHGVRLLKAFEQWALNRKVCEICFGINSETEMISVGRFARRMGYRSVGENFVKEISP